MDGVGLILDSFTVVSADVLKTVNFMALLSRGNAIDGGTGQGNAGPNAYLLSPSTAEKIKKGSVHSKADRLSWVP